MTYDKPKVTIDLDEYCYLKEEIKDLKSGEEQKLITALKVGIVAACQTSTGWSISKIHDAMIKEGYYLAVKLDTHRAYLTVEDLIIKKIEK